MTDVRSEGVTTGGTPRAGAGWGWILAYGIVSAVLGVLAFLSPFSATLAATLVVGAFLTATGIMALAAGLFGRGHHHRGYKMALGVLSIVAGLLTAFRPFAGALSITLLLAAWLFMRGAMEIGWGVRHQRHRFMMLALGVLNVLLAIFILATVPLSAFTVPGYVLGVSLLIGGATAIASGLAHRKGASAFALS
jgi:uncharacterized membrane protein HdeD (DUF308 family)